ncbi:Nramp family divalent metal transporter [Geodermatophilus sp. YIM 151500]|uniref:Nramp family divalent metal transporter n=1 Tax=Geodermatophilus sp. YIM 151500 TaxID=2984531 RepID=UPI0021E4DB74|nr:Nramp family divalent metal transporter [Geodermatophilus sp. YIM 151500]MCV2490078.1 Nramp family divalent metal transporter [Geodermatophilus sp. YIM 151500]
MDSPRPQGGDLATELPSKALPAVPYADLPEPLRLKQVLGPSVLLLAGAIGSGEFVLWPYITSQVGLAVVWLVIIGVLTQYFLNMEIERYTLVTGETAVTGFTRLWKPWSWLFIIMTVVPWMWPGWATGGTTTLGFVLGFGEDAIPWITIGVLVLIGAVLTASPVVYRTVEKIQFFMVGLIVLFLVYALLFLVGGEGYAGLGEGLVSVGELPGAVSTIGTATLLGAIAFAGAGGSLNLAQSNWVRDKGLAMGARLPKVVSPFTGEEIAAPTTGFMCRRDEANMRRWRDWWRVADREQFVTFFVIGLIALLTFMMLAYSTIGVGTTEAQSFDFIRAQGEALGDAQGSWLSTTFWLIGSVVLFSTNLAVLDMVGRVTADVLKTGPLRNSTTWSESKIYFAIVWAEIVFGSVILLSGVTQPLILLVIASSLNGLVMFVYSALLIQLNRRTLPAEFRTGGVRLGALVWAVLFYGFFSVILLVDQFGNLVGGG